MHGVYFALQSDGNKVYGKNTFSSISGDAVRAADFSNNNTVSGATFNRTGTLAAFSAWRLKRDTRCSHGNVLRTSATKFSAYRAGRSVPAVRDGADDKKARQCTPRAVVRKSP
jgi:hypothetical protein